MPTECCAQAFTNEARADGLQLRHWVKGYKDASGRVRLAEEYEGEYKYVKYNKKVSGQKASVKPHKRCWKQVWQPTVHLPPHVLRLSAHPCLNVAARYDQRAALMFTYLSSTLIDH